MPAATVFENLEAGMSIEEVIEQLPVTREQLDSLMAFVARSLEKLRLRSSSDAGQAAAVNSAQTGSYVEVEVPFKDA